jgi:hypothetical protein
VATQNFQCSKARNIYVSTRRVSVFCRWHKLKLCCSVVTRCTTCLITLRLCTVPTECICVFRMLTIKSDCFPKQHQPVGLRRGEAMFFLCDTNWISIYDLDEYLIQRFLTSLNKRKNELITTLHRGLFCSSVTIQTTQRRTERRFMNNECERIWKEVVVAISRYNPGICL